MMPVAGHIVRGVGAAVVLVAVSIGASSGPASAADPLAAVKFAVGDIALFERTSIGTGFGDPGSWKFDRGVMADGRLRLHVEITPVRQTLPVASGPAVLFAGLNLYGDAGGDVGIGISVAPITHQVIPACDDADCHYSTDISIPIDRLPKAISQLEQDGDLIWVSADMTLVRTFGAGEWLQVLALQQGPDGIAGAAAGRLGAMQPTSGRINWAGLFPASQATPVTTGHGNLPALDYRQVVEALRLQADDPSTAIPAVTAAINVRFVRGCLYWTELTLHDDFGNHLLYEDDIQGLAQITGSTTIPAGRAWFLTLDAGEGVQRPLLRLGPIEPDGSGAPVGITATIDCSGPSGTLVLSGAATPTPIPTRPPLSSVGPPASFDTSPAGPTTHAASAPPTSPSPATPAGPALVALALLMVSAVVLTALLLRRRTIRS